MTILYEGYQFLLNKQVWTCIYLRQLAGNYEPMWTCQSDQGMIRNLGVSQIATYPQVLTGPQWDQRPADLEDDHMPSRGRYIRGCRCDGCRAANADYIKAWRWRRG